MVNSSHLVVVVDSVLVDGLVSVLVDVVVVFLGLKIGSHSLGHVQAFMRNFNQITTINGTKARFQKLNLQKRLSLFHYPFL